LAFAISVWPFVHQKVYYQTYLEDGRDKDIKNEANCWKSFKEKKCNIDELTQEC
jgi:hypothetical protein